MEIQHAKDLLQRYLSGESTVDEKELVEQWYQQLYDTGELEGGKDENYLVGKLIETKILNQINDQNRAKVFRLFPFSKWWAAASIIFLTTFCYFFFFHKTDRIANQHEIAEIKSNDVKAPQSNKATITLANGQKVYLDSVGNRALALQGNVKLVKLASGKIEYQQNLDGARTKIEYNTLTNPRGSKVINITLTDGSKVWLNAGSSLRYPVSFNGTERKVSVTGEAYFEVTHDVFRPFFVNNGSMEIRVLGTSFNVNAFKDEGNNIMVTLLAGSVKVNEGSAIGILKPGQQAVVNGEIKVMSDVNLSRVMAWKNGYFQFDNASLQSVLKEVSRWYDVDVVYEGKNQPRRFVGEIQRDLSLSEMLKILEKNKVYFKIERKELKVMAD